MHAGGRVFCPSSGSVPGCIVRFWSALRSAFSRQNARKRSPEASLPSTQRVDGSERRYRKAFTATVSANLHPKSLRDRSVASALLRAAASGARRRDRNAVSVDDRGGFFRPRRGGSSRLNDAGQRLADTLRRLRVTAFPARA